MFYIIYVLVFNHHQRLNPLDACVCINTSIKPLSISFMRFPLFNVGRLHIILTKLAWVHACHFNRIVCYIYIQNPTRIMCAYEHIVSKHFKLSCLPNQTSTNAKPRSTYFKLSCLPDQTLTYFIRPTDAVQTKILQISGTLSTHANEIKRG
jgi:hypothetical protein